MAVVPESMSSFLETELGDLIQETKDRVAKINQIGMFKEGDEERHVVNALIDWVKKAKRRAAYVRYKRKMEEFGQEPYSFDFFTSNTRDTGPSPIKGAKTAYQRFLAIEEKKIDVGARVLYYNSEVTVLSFTRVAALVVDIKGGKMVVDPQSVVCIDPNNDSTS